MPPFCASVSSDFICDGFKDSQFNLDFSFSIYTDVEDLKEQEIVSRIMAGLLENYYEFFENEEEDFSSNDLSSITEQVRIF